MSFLGPLQLKVINLSMQNKMGTISTHSDKPHSRIIIQLQLFLKIYRQLWMECITHNKCIIIYIYALYFISDNGETNNANSE